MPKYALISETAMTTSGAGQRYHHTPKPIDAVDEMAAKQEAHKELDRLRSRGALWVNLKLLDGTTGKQILEIQHPQNSN